MEQRNTTFPYDMIFTKADASNSDEQVDKLTREVNIFYRYCIWSFIYLLSTISYFSFSVHKLAGKVNFEWLVHLLIYIRNSKTLGLNYYADMKYAPLSDLSIQASIKTENQLIAFYYSSCKYFTDTGRSTGAYIIFNQGGPIDHGTHVPGTVAQSSTESKYNSSCTSGMALAHFRMLIHEFLSKDPFIVP